jgi:hypothetical protein
LFKPRPAQRDERATWHDRGLGRGTELAITPLVFVGIGWLLDQWLGTRPVATLVVAAIGITGTFVKIWLGYDRDMRAAEEGKPWTRRPGSGPSEPGSGATHGLDDGPATGPAIGGTA